MKIPHLVLCDYSGSACLDFLTYVFPLMQNISTIQKNILARYHQHGRKLPRRKTRDPYAIHVSEVMLQQTQVERVIPYFQQRMKDFPDYKSLARASKTDLLRHRSGLGFNSRALRLQKCAKIVVSSEYWVLRKKYKKNVGADTIRLELQKLPGIGPYTSAAILAFAYNLPVPLIDTNIRRVLIFLFKLDEKISMSELETFATKIIPAWKSRDRHNALMDQWALLLTARKTKIKPLSKQSRFEWSDRQVRWRILKQLTKLPITWSVVAENKLPITLIQNEFPKKDIKKILKGMQQEWLIHIKKWVITIAE